MNKPVGQSDAYLLTLEVETVCADDVAEWVRELLSCEPIELMRPGSSVSWLELYFSSAIEAELAWKALQSDARILGHTQQKVPAREWQAFWQDHFKPVQIARRFNIVPVWLKDEVPEEDDLSRIVINPGLSFGTGTHFTTRFCLETMAAIAEQGTLSSMLDLGTGSGILAIAGEKLGCSRVLALDHDAQALEQARENLDLNDLEPGVICLEQADLTTFSPTESFPLVCANLFDVLLVSQAEKIWSQTEGSLIATGIREAEVEHVAQTFIRLGAVERTRDGDGEWAGLLLCRENETGAA